MLRFLRWLEDPINADKVIFILGAGLLSLIRWLKTPEGAMIWAFTIYIAYGVFVSLNMKKFDKKEKAT